MVGSPDSRLPPRRVLLSRLTSFLSQARSVRFRRIPPPLLRLPPPPRPWFLPGRPNPPAPGPVVPPVPPPLPALRRMLSRQLGMTLTVFVSAGPEAAPPVSFTGVLAYLGQDYIRLSLVSAEVPTASTAAAIPLGMITAVVAPAP